MYAVVRCGVRLKIIFAEAGHLHQVTEQPRLERLIAVDGDGQPDVAPGPAVAVMAALHAQLKTSHDAQESWRTLCRRPTSYRNLHHAVAPGHLRGRYINGQTPLDRLLQVTEQLLESLALGSTTRYGRDFRPVAALFRLVNYNFELHATIIRSSQLMRRASNARHHPPPRHFANDEIIRVGGQVHAVVRLRSWTPHCRR